VAGIATAGPGSAGGILQLLFILTAIATGCLIGAFLYSGLLHVRRARWWRQGADPGGERSEAAEEGTL
jgi:hypothetical protein